MDSVQRVSKPTETEIIDIHQLKDLATPFYFEMSKNFNTILSEINDENNKLFNIN
jgi:hypothetical protein